jgi:hypothetical protein
MTSEPEQEGRRKGRKRFVISLASIVAEAAILRFRAGKFGGRVVVRCREGHLFTTLWIPGASVKALRLGWVRLQRCPVDKHWGLVTPVRESELSDDEARLAREHRDVQVP